MLENQPEGQMIKSKKSFEEKDRKNYIKKMFGIHAAQIFVFSMYIIYCQMDKENMIKIARNHQAFYINIAIFVAIAGALLW